MRRAALRANDEVLGQEARDELLRAIANARDVARDVDQRLSVLPPWALAPGSPLGDDRERLVAAATHRKTTGAVVAQLETRLSTAGPVWTLLSATEKNALDQWIGAISTQNDILGKYMPTETERDVRKLVLGAIGALALFAPLLWTEEEPYHKPIGPVIPPPWLGPKPPPAAGIPGGRLPFRPAGGPVPTPPPTAAAIPFAPAAPAATPAIVRIPGAPPAMPRPGATTITPADLMRMPIPGSPFQGGGPGGAPPGTSTIQPIGPGIFRPTSTPGTSTLTPLGPTPGGGMPIYPRFQRT